MTTILTAPEVRSRPPSREDGIDPATEEQLRCYGVGLIQRAAVLLKVHQFTVVSAAVMLQRFYFRRSFAEFEVRGLATAALALACKFHETHRKLRDLIVVVHRLQMRGTMEDGKPLFESRPTPGLDISSKEYADLKHDVLRSERNLLRELGFEVAVHLDPPHRYVLEYSDLLQTPKGLLQMAWNYLNDSLRTTLCCCHAPSELAAAALLLAARQLRVKLPSSPSWWEAVGAEGKDRDHIAKSMLALYKKAAGEYVHIRRRKTATAADAPMTPFAETPFVVAKSPSDDDGQRREEEGNEAEDPGAEQDEGRILEILAEKDGAELHSMDPPAAPPMKESRAEEVKPEDSTGFDRSEDLRRSRRAEKDRDRDRDRAGDRGRERERDRPREDGRKTQRRGERFASSSRSRSRRASRREKGCRRAGRSSDESAERPRR